MQPDTPTAPRSSRRRLVTSFAALAAVLMTTGCSDDSWGINESDVPQEASLAYPGAHLEQRSWSPGQKGTYIDGGSAEFPPELSLMYSTPPTDVAAISAWYQAKLEPLGYVMKPPDLSGSNLGVDGVKQIGQLTVRFGVVGAATNGVITGYQVRVFVTPAGT
jgi:hypothetical protein